MRGLEGRVAFVTGAARGIGRAVAIYVDVTDGDSVRAAVAAAERALGPIDVLVNNAGWDKVEAFVSQRGGDLGGGDRHQLERRAALHGCVVEGMVARRHGRIVSIASDAARVGSTGEAVYSAAKSGVIAFSKTLAREVARHGIDVNAVCPGPTDTPLVHRALRPDRRGTWRAATPSCKGARRISESIGRERARCSARGGSVGRWRR